MYKLVEKEDARNRLDEKCFYCQQKMGTPHRYTCPILTKKVKIRMIVEYVVDVPLSWDKQMIEFHRNDSSWCSGNAIGELEKLAGKNDCLCNYTKFEYIEKVKE